MGRTLDERLAAQEMLLLKLRSDLAAWRLLETVRSGRDPLGEAPPEAKYNPNWANQPRAPAGTPTGGQWVDGGGGGFARVRDLRLPRTPARTQPSPPRPAPPPPPPPPRAPFGPASSLLTGHAVLEQMRRQAERRQVRDTIERFGLDPNSGRDVLAARAYVWGKNIVPSILAPPFLSVPYSGPANERVAQALMRYELQSPGALGLAEAGDPQAAAAIREVVSAAMENRPGPAPLQISPGFAISTNNDEERALVDAMRARGASSSQIQAALDELRLNRASTHDRASPRNRAGIAHASGPLVRIRGAWLRGTQSNIGPVPQQVAQRLIGRRFETFRQFRAEFWRTVANTPELAVHFSSANLASMRNGNAPVAPEAQHFGEIRSYIIHHRTPVARGGPLYDMSNMLIVTPRMLQEILDRTYHFGSRRTVE